MEDRTIPWPRRMALVLVAAAAAAATSEVASLVALRALYGTWSGARPEAGLAEGSETEPGEKRPTGPREVLHPYLGYALEPRPESRTPGSMAELGFPGGGSFPTGRTDGGATVLVLG